jgi:hypothetical protein
MEVPAFSCQLHWKLQQTSDVQAITLPNLPKQTIPVCGCRVKGCLLCKVVCHVSSIGNKVIQSSVWHSWAERAQQMLFWTPIVPWIALTARLPVCDPEHRPISRFCSEILIFTLDWRSCRLCLAVLFADLQIHPSSLAISCAPSTHLCTDTLCLLADSLGLEDPPPCMSVTARTR